MLIIVCCGDRRRFVSVALPYVSLVAGGGTTVVGSQSKFVCFVLEIALTRHTILLLYDQY